MSTDLRQDNRYTVADNERLEQEGLADDERALVKVFCESFKGKRQVSKHPIDATRNGLDFLQPATMRIALRGPSMQQEKLLAGTLQPNSGPALPILING